MCKLMGVCAKNRARFKYCDIYFFLYIDFSVDNQ